MDYRNKAAYLKGLVEGLNLDDSKKETKILKVITDFCHDVADELEKLRDDCSENKDLIYELDEDLGEIEKIFYDNKQLGCGGSSHGCGCGQPGDDLVDNGDYDEHDEYVNSDDGEDEEDGDEEKYEVLCPHCSQVINLENASLKENEIVCPQCGKELELDFDEVDAKDY